ASDTIKEVAVWMRISGLPIEYYDSRILHFIGNRVGKTVKVDKNTLTQERGKYARLCVQVNLTKPLLAMFTIKDRKYNIEYEGLHLLCTTCGRFGHYKEGCPEKVKEHAEKRDERGVGGEEGSRHNHAGSGVEGPWCVVKKQKRNRKTGPARNTLPEEHRDAPGRINAPNISPGSRFASLGEDMLEVNRESLDREENMQELNLAGNDVGRENHVEFEKRSQRTKNRRGNNGGGAAKGDVADHNKKENKLAARGGGNLKGKMGEQVKKGVENLADKMGEKFLENLMGQYQKPNGTSSGNEGNGRRSSETVLSPNVPGKVGLPNRPRPPNWNHTPFQVTTVSTTSRDEELVREGEVFLDADEQGPNTSYDADMDIVVETPSLEQ
ncbi:hypothetical protein A2U01_0002062, partial [Trifolium medium]|nr:hypothetical protein [Trifolium medium]